MATTPSSRPTRCRNCKELPKISEQSGRYPWLLVHRGQTCPGQFAFEAHQATRQVCVQKWNEFNQGPKIA